MERSKDDGKDSDCGDEVKMEQKFSVLMSLYIKEKPEYFKECMESIIHQTVIPTEIVIVKDGPLTEGLESVLNEYVEKEPNLYKIVSLKKNVGLGLALAEGVKNCTYELIARMDTDDIARKDRFEIQLQKFVDNPKLDICGSHIIEFEGNVNNILSERKVPLQHKKIVKYQRQRSAFNHMTVMYKKSMVLNAGNYEHCPLMEDDMMWVRMILAGAKCANIDDNLVYARTGSAMIERRGGMAYLKKYKHGRKKILKTGYISQWDYLKTVGIQTVVALIPTNIRLFIFLKLLR